MLLCVFWTPEILFRLLHLECLPLKSHPRYDKASVSGKRALKQLASGHYGVLWGVLGDLDYMNKVLLLPKSTLASGPCSLCKCTGSGPLAWTDFRKTAGWRGVQWTAAEWRVWPGRSKSPLFDYPNFSPWNICMDWLHAKYLGLDQLVYGSILSLLCYHVMAPKGTPQYCLGLVWTEIQRCYKMWDTPCRYRYLNRLSMFQRRTPQYPKLRGKGAEIKYLCRPLLSVWEKFSNPQLKIHKLIHLYLKINCEVEEMLITHKMEMSLPSEEAAKFEELVEHMLLVLTSIADHFIGDKLFGLTQKAHFIQHLALLAKYLNPRVVWCFMGEDHQKRMSGLAKTCVKGQQAGQTIFKMLHRYRLALELQFRQHTS